MRGARPDMEDAQAPNEEAFIDSPTEAERRASFTALYETYFHRILGYARRRTVGDEALDIVAETFTVAWRRLDDVPGGDDSLYWLYGTARRVLANHRRAERRRANLLGALQTDAARTAAVSPPVDDDRVAGALARLRDDERELLLLVAWEGLDAGGVATVMRCSRNAARIRIHRARRRFAEELASAGADVKRTGTSGHVPSAALGLEERP